MTRKVTNIFIITFISLILVDGLPSTSQFHRWLKGPVDKVTDYLGIWQGSWNLFAPNVDKTNVRLEAMIKYRDGSELIWNSPVWAKMGPVEKFLTFRQAEFYDDVRMDRNRGAWEPLAIYLAKQHPKDETEVRSIELLRIWSEAPPPEGEPFHEHEFMFYTRNFE